MIRKSNNNLFRIEYNINEENSSLDLYLPENEVKKNYLNNFKKNICFKYDEIFNEASQDEVYDKIGPEIVDNAINGYNNTILCYGQTSSGKTYTMSGGKSWKERGIIPRIIVDLFKTLENNFEFEIFVSYLEIYNENGYDLLDIKLKNNIDIEKWTKIVVYEDNVGNIIVKNLRSVKVSNDTEALDLFMSGNYYRQVSSTPQNMASSRSHAVFTISLIRKIEEKIISSKINLVDLAGSERLNKSSLMQSHVYNTFENYSTMYFSDVPQLISETKSINLSLSFLEQVITALNEKGKNKQIKHIPYRNSLMTTLLKDSLGGNCKTILIANVSMDLNNLDETISTLRFMNRCSKIENEIVVNYEVDSNLIINNLKNENLVLKEKISLLEKHNKTINNNNNKIHKEKSSRDNIGAKSISLTTNKLEVLKLENSEMENQMNTHLKNEKLKKNNGINNIKLMNNNNNSLSQRSSIYEDLKPIKYIPLNEKQKFMCNKMIDDYVCKHKEKLINKNDNDIVNITDYLKVNDSSELLYIIDLLVEYINTKDLQKENNIKKEDKSNIKSNKNTNMSSLLKN